MKTTSGRAYHSVARGWVLGCLAAVAVALSGCGGPEPLGVPMAAAHEGHEDSCGSASTPWSMNGIGGIALRGGILYYPQTDPGIAGDHALAGFVMDAFGG